MTLCVKVLHRRIPSGLGVREFFLTLFLVPELASEGQAARGTAVLTVIVLRLVWTVAELGMAGVVYCLPVRPPLAAKPFIETAIGKPRFFLSCITRL